MKKIWKKYKLFLFIFLLMLPIKVSANELKILMFDSNFCMFCEAWEQEIGIVFEKSDYAKYFQLMRRDRSKQDQINIDLKSTVIGTPTFVIINKNREIGRIVGYSGAEMFWWQLSEFSPNHK